MKQSFILLFFVFCASAKSYSQAKPVTISSPDKKVQVSFWTNRSGEPKYAVSYQSQPVLKESRLGLVRDDGDFAGGLQFVKATPVQMVKDQYELFTGKKRQVSYSANKSAVQLRAKNGKRLDIIFQVSNDGVAFRYFFPDKEGGIKTVTEERTSFHFDTSARGFLQPMQVSKTGWEKTNPAYEEHYRQNIPVTDTAPTPAGWVYPALFQTKNAWVLVSEAAVDTNYCGTRLQSGSPDGEYRIGFPDPREIKTGGGILPISSSPFYSPWRIIAVGTLGTMVESTLGTDVAKPAIAMDKSFIKPGKSSWSWIMSKDDSIVYSEQVRYIDFAAKMNWQYCLVDAAWDQKIGYEKIEELSRYASAKNVGLLLWYNSAGDWNTVKYTPKNKLLTQEDRTKEFSRLKAMGIKGVKIDFFGGDGQSVMQYYIDILKDAAQAGLLVNFHGATLPRGWHRTYPNLVTTEAVRGFEMITFNQADADAAANHCAMLPFTRNVFDPMDFTPMNLYRIPTRVKRRTSSGFELATAVLFLSGIQHFAESPSGMSHVPAFVQQFLRELPVRWDEVKFIEGYPGKYAVIARRAGSRWYIAGINAENAEKSIALNLHSFKKKSGLLINDDGTASSFVSETMPVINTSLTKINMKPSGGFVMVLD
ncbi:MAG TPA: glycoside hydrolase family 97 catalytic domain-containing protein [Flavisolibacter sp.]|nr:glycoside hydrolase family 97 catalytic domain-containing protein [Flavisolibacter sp.]